MRLFFSNLDTHVRPPFIHYSMFWMAGRGAHARLIEIIFHFIWHIYHIGMYMTPVVVACRELSKGLQKEKSA